MYLPCRYVVATKGEEDENCGWEYFIDGTVRRFWFGRTTLSKLAIVPDIVGFRDGFRVGIFLQKTRGNVVVKQR